MTTFSKDAAHKIINVLETAYFAYRKDRKVTETCRASNIDIRLLDITKQAYHVAKIQTHIMYRGPRKNDTQSKYNKQSNCLRINATSFSVYQRSEEEIMTNRVSKKYFNKKYDKSLETMTDEQRAIAGHNNITAYRVEMKAYRVEMKALRQAQSSKASLT